MVMDGLKKICNMTVQFFLVLPSIWASVALFEVCKVYPLVMMKSRM